MKLRLMSHQSLQVDLLKLQVQFPGSRLQPHELQLQFAGSNYQFPKLHTQSRKFNLKFRNCKCDLPTSRRYSKIQYAICKSAIALAEIQVAIRKISNAIPRSSKHSPHLPTQFVEIYFNGPK